MCRNQKAQTRLFQILLDVRLILTSAWKLDNERTQFVTTDKLPRLAIWLVPAALSIIALAKMPYGYYQFLRIVICVAAAYLAHMEYKLMDEGVNAWVITFTLLAILFNPLIPIHLKRDIWAFLNVTCAAIFIGHLTFKIKNNQLDRKD